MWPGACVTQSGSAASASADWGVTPQAQKTGTSPGATRTASPKSGAVRSSIPSAAGSPQ